MNKINKIKPSVDQEALIKNRIVAFQNETLEVSLFKILRTKLLKQLRTNNWNSFGITSPTKNSGKTMIAVNLAIVMAMELNQTILLVDMDLKNPKIHQYFNNEVKNSLKDGVEQDLSISELLIHPNIERLTLLLGKDPVIQSSEMITSPIMKNLVKTFKTISSSQITLFNLPPVLNSDDVLASLDYYDAMLLVVEEGGNTSTEIKQSLNMLSDINLLGTVLNKSQMPSDYQ